MPFPANPDKQHVKDSQPRQGCSQAPETSQSPVFSESTLPRCTVIFPSKKWVGTEDHGPRAVPPPCPRSSGCVPCRATPGLAQRCPVPEPQRGLLCPGTGSVPAPAEEPGMLQWEARGSSSALSA